MTQKLNLRWRGGIILMLKINAGGNFIMANHIEILGYDEKLNTIFVRGKSFGFSSEKNICARARIEIVALQPCPAWQKCAS